MDAHIRPAEPGDAPGIAAIITGLGWFEPEPGGDLEARVRRLVAGAAPGGPHGVFVAVLPDGDIAGYVAVHFLPYLIFRGPDAYVSELFVAEQARGGGAGTRLLEAARAEAHRRGCVRLSLLNSTARESYARGFYASRGWTERRDMVPFLFPLDTPDRG